MKKSLLITATSLLALGATAQEKVISIGGTEQNSLFEASKVRNSFHRAAHDGTANKTTSAPRWYSWVNYFDTSEKDLTSSIAFSAPYLWRDTMAVMAYTATGGGTDWAHNRTVSMGLAIDPSFSGFNDLGYYDGEMKITSSDPYTVDSLIVYGLYGFNVANTYVDTVRVAFVYGDASSTADVYMANSTNPTVLARYGLASTDTMHTYRMHFDTVGVRASGTTVVVRDILLDNTGASPAWGDTLSNGIMPIAVSLGDVSVPAGNMIGASVSFLSGDPTFVAHDTVFGSTMGYKHNMFRPYVAFRGTASTPNFATYSPDNHNSGMFKTLPDTALGWGGQFIPLWFWSSTGGAASTFQYPYIDFHIKCPTCGIVTMKVDDLAQNIQAEAYPNPATGVVNIPFTLATASNVTVTLSNMLGQTVDSRQLTGVAKGKVQFNTSSLPDGIYSYSVMANGQKVSGRIAIRN